MVADHGEIVQRWFVSRPQHVEAVPWDGRNVAEVLAAIPDKTRYDRTTARMFLLAGVQGAQEWVPVPDGYWLVHPPGDLSDVWPVEDSFFQAKYEPVLSGSREAPDGR